MTDDKQSNKDWKRGCSFDFLLNVSSSDDLLVQTWSHIQFRMILCVTKTNVTKLIAHGMKGK